MSNTDKEPILYLALLIAGFVIGLLNDAYGQECVYPQQRVWQHVHYGIGFDGAPIACSQQCEPSSQQTLIYRRTTTTVRTTYHEYDEEPRVVYVLSQRPVEKPAPAPAPQIIYKEPPRPIVINFNPPGFSFLNNWFSGNRSNAVANATANKAEVRDDTDIKYHEEEERGDFDKMTTFDRAPTRSEWVKAKKHKAKRREADDDKSKGSK